VRARGDSMLPFLRHGDVLHVRPLPAAAVCVGDVICYAPAPGGSTSTVSSRATSEGS
jgi:hypothetical protein